MQLVTESFYRNKTVAIVGGGDSAAVPPLGLSMISQRYILVRSRIRAAEIVVKRMYEKRKYRGAYGIHSASY